MHELDVIFEPDGKIVRAEIGATISDIATAGGIHIEGPCGGRGTCGKCRVIAQGELSQLSPNEREHLSSEEIEAGVRLACQTKLLSNATVQIPRTTRLLAQKILDHGVHPEIPLDPDVRKIALKLDKPSLEDQRTDFERIKNALPGDGGIQGELDLLRDLPGRIRAHDFQVTAVIADGELIAVEGGDTSTQTYGMAFDIGTTTVVGYLLHLTTGEELSVSARMNPQVIYGDDVISRIGFAAEHKDGLTKLHRKITNAVEEMALELCERTGVDPHRVYEMTLAGNTCMHHLFLGLDPKNIASIPFIPVVSESLSLHAKELNLNLHPRSKIHMLPNIAGYVGADIVADILSSRLYTRDQPTLLVDIGTNGEIVLSAGGKMMACSAAAGPAFEGARICCGMRGADGAIDQVVFDEDVSYTTIEGMAPRGICGSGLLDVIAEMLRTGIIDPMGRILSPEDQPTLPEPLRSRIAPGEQGSEFLLVRAEETASGRPIRITQKDVRELQLAKSAIRTGIEILKEKMDVKDEELSDILLAGAFGNYLRKESALAVGLLPPVPVEKITPIGNAAGEGAKMVLLSREESRQAQKLARDVDYVELSAEPTFMDGFAMNMLFPM